MIMGQLFDEYLLIISLTVKDLHAGDRHLHWIPCLYDWFHLFLFDSFVQIILICPILCDVPIMLLNIVVIYLTLSLNKWEKGDKKRLVGWGKKCEKTCNFSKLGCIFFSSIYIKVLFSKESKISHFWCLPREDHKSGPAKIWE